MPLSAFADDLIDLHIYMQTATVARRWNLRGRQEAPGEGAMRDLLTRRYEYAVDDIPHRDILDCVESEGNLLLLDAPTEDGNDDYDSKDSASV
jgi:hypothetical protein